MSESRRFLPIAERIVWVGFMMFFLIIAMIYIFRGMGLERDLQDAQAEALALQMQLFQRESVEVIDDAIIGLTREQERRLQRLGLRNPAAQLRDDLSIHADLIAGAGSDWRFVEHDIHILSDRWILAGVTDGRQSSQVLLAFDVAFGRIQWQMLDTAFDR
ncbi:hypothetical protein SAMN05216526_1226 [Ectothiorhodosinus mongolicus]|uniref:Uncharacterized protein n=1 Tax=Ectothiorhodosinus mongolicus TaxID=233100 RepID=A0A1R3VXY9_9GAMM|nr:hypothetical protein [Ectothiorhodosinus mongolicus]ULX57131.1 hypothetical protein CKX93_05145 [Ectothiorhodosinus mongolicus]SIT70067.1 hypothetical protein SAMN05216526_1226 [Ectothiorhodosinus mongolicus]